MAMIQSHLLQLPLERAASGTSGRSVFEVDHVPLWGFTSMCRKRFEMEDEVADFIYLFIFL
jgi:protein phosphatase 2C